MIREWLEIRRIRKLAVKITMLMITIPLIPKIIEHIRETQKVLDGGA